MPRLRGLVAATLIGVGAILAVDGSHGLSTATRLLADHGWILLLVLAGLAALQTIAPANSLVGPFILAAAGVLVFALKEGGIGWPAAGGLLLLIGGRLAMVTSGENGKRLDPLRREFAVIFRRQIEFDRDQIIPEELSIVAIAAVARVTFHEGAEYERETAELLVTCWAGGHVELRVPRHWAVVAGRVGAAHGIRFKGRLDDPRLFRDPHHKDHDELVKIAEARWRDHPPAPGAGLAQTLVVHVMGLGGWVTLLRQDCSHQVAGPSPRREEQEEQA
jgi:hypothetical protein